jgi:hypothetical protein
MDLQSTLNSIHDQHRALTGQKVLTSLARPAGETPGPGTTVQRGPKPLESPATPPRGRC